MKPCSEPNSAPRARIRGGARPRSGSEPWRRGTHRGYVRAGRCLSGGQRRAGVLISRVVRLSMQAGPGRGTVGGARPVGAGPSPFGGGLHRRVWAPWGSTPGPMAADHLRGMGSHSRGSRRSGRGVRGQSARGTTCARALADPERPNGSCTAARSSGRAAQLHGRASRTCSAQRDSADARSGRICPPPGPVSGAPIFLTGVQNRPIKAPPKRP